MATTMDQLGRCVAEWRVTLLNKGLKANAEESKTLESGPALSVRKE